MGIAFYCRIDINCSASSQQSAFLEPNQQTFMVLSSLTHNACNTSTSFAFGRTIARQQQQKNCRVPHLHYSGLCVTRMEPKERLHKIYRFQNLGPAQCHSQTMKFHSQITAIEPHYFSYLTCRFSW